MLKLSFTMVELRIQCLKAYKYDMSKIKIPKDHQKYLQREFPMGSGAGSGIY